MTSRRWPVRRALVVALFDATLCGLAYLVSFYLRVGDDILTWPPLALWGGLALFVAVAALVCQAFGLPAGSGAMPGSTTSPPSARRWC